MSVYAIATTIILVLLAVWLAVSFVSWLFR